MTDTDTIDRFDADVAIVGCGPVGNEAMAALVGDEPTVVPDLPGLGSGIVHATSPDAGRPFVQGVVVNSASSVEAGQAVSDALPRGWIPESVPQCNSARGFARDEDLEAALRAHPAIDDAVLLDADVEGSGQKVVAVWSWAEGRTATVAAVLADVRSRALDYTVPGSVIIVNAIPRTTADTVDDMVIRQIVSVARLVRRGA